VKRILYKSSSTQLEMKEIIVLIISALFLSCNQTPEESPSISFEKDIEELKEYFHIPGMASIITQKGEIIYENYSGYADIKTGRLVDSTTVFPLNSICKTYAAVLSMQLVETGALNVNDPINHYLENSSLSDDIKVKHILSHTSEATPGSFFNYSGYRYHYLTEVLEKASGKRYDALIKDKILDPLGLSNTFFPLNHAALDSLVGARIAEPYYYSGELKQGRYETFKSTSGGLISTARDLAKFDHAFNSGRLISPQSRREMTSSFSTSIGHSPYGYGIFLQTFLGKQLIWGYGQGEYSSSLILNIPEDEITLILLSNTNQMSDVPRLISGDVTFSLFALSFLKHFVFDLPIKFGAHDLSNREDLDIALTHNKYEAFYRQELWAKALASGTMGFTYSDTINIHKSKEQVALALELFPNYISYGSQQLMLLLSALSTYGSMNEVDAAVENMGTSLLEINPMDPYTNICLGDYYKYKNKEAQAMVHYKRIADVDNYSPRAWFWVEALGHLGEYYEKEDPDLAKQYYQKIVDIGWNLGGLLDKAKEKLAE